MYGRRGWFGNSQGHSLAAQGVRMYARKEQVLVDPVFYAKKREQQVSIFELLRSVRSGMTFKEMRQQYPDVDVEDLRKRGIRALEMQDGSAVLSDIDKLGVDASAKRAKENPALQQRMIETLRDPQRSSFLHQQKVSFLLERLTK